MRTNQNVLNSWNCPRFARRMWILLVSMWQAQEYTHTDTSWHTFFKTDVTTAIRSAHPSSCAFLSIPSAAKAPPPPNPSSFLLQVTAANCLGRGKRWFKLGCKAVWAGSGLLNNHHELTHLSSFIFIDFLALESRPLDKESLPACSYACKITGFHWFLESHV